jgi:uncharacterized protein YidB (DUF937 family)
MSPITMAVLGLLAYKALKSFTGQSGASPATPPVPRPGTSVNAGAGGGGGGLGDLLKNGLGGALAGGAAGSILSGGLGDLLKQFQQSGLGDVAKSWVGSGPNQPVSADDLGKVLGSDQIKNLMAHSGLSRDDLLDALHQYLPQVVDQLSPQGRLPSEQEVSRSL